MAAAGGLTGPRNTPLRPKAKTVPPRTERPLVRGLRTGASATTAGTRCTRALFIGPFIEHAIKGWRRRHRGGAGETCAISEELRRIAGCRGHKTVSTALKEWIRGHGEDAGTISSAQAFKWPNCAERARRCARMAEVPLGKRGPSSRQPAVAEKYRVGRAVHKAFNRMQGLRGDDGQMIQDPARVDQMLRDSKKGLWGSAPPMPELADTILGAYFLDRSASLPDVPRPCSRDIAGHVLAAGGSAPRHNGIPYEAYHQGVELVTDALALAVPAAHHDPAVLDKMLGPSVDLLLWILKKAGADRPDVQRPLQLPTCFWTLSGSVVTSMVAPQVEPRFSEWQASVKGCSCARNTTSAFEHLGGFDEPVHGPAGALCVAGTTTTTTTTATGDQRGTEAASPTCGRGLGLADDRGARAREPTERARRRRDLRAAPKWLMGAPRYAGRDGAARTIPRRTPGRKVRARGDGDGGTPIRGRAAPRAAGGGTDPKGTTAALMRGPDGAGAGTARVQGATAAVPTDCARSPPTPQRRLVAISPGKSGSRSSSPNPESRPPRVPCPRLVG